MDGTSFATGTYIYGLESGAYGVVEGKTGDAYNFDNILFVKTLSGEFMPGETIIDENSIPKRIAREGTISHFKVLSRGINYSDTTKILINGVEYSNAAVQPLRPTGGSSIYTVKINNRDVVNQVYATPPAITATVGSGAVIIPVMFRDTVVTYTPKNVKSLSSK